MTAEANELPEATARESGRAPAAIVQFSSQAIAYAQEPVLPVYAVNANVPVLDAPEPTVPAEQGSASGEEAQPASGTRASAEGSGFGELTEEERAILAELKKRDAEVRTHENAHRSTAGGHAGSPSYTFQVGPDGRRYAIGGEVPLDVGPVKNDPNATIAKMESIVRAALAPASPSGADYRIAANARANLQAARVELARERQGAVQSSGSDPSAKPVFTTPEERPAVSGPAANDTAPPTQRSVTRGSSFAPTSAAL